MEVLWIWPVLNIETFRRQSLWWALLQQLILYFWNLLTEKEDSTVLWSTILEFDFGNMFQPFSLFQAISYLLIESTKGKRLIKASLVGAMSYKLMMDTLADTVGRHPCAPFCMYAPEASTEIYQEQAEERTRWGCHFQRWQVSYPQWGFRVSQSDWVSPSNPIICPTLRNKWYMIRNPCSCLFCVFLWWTMKRVFRSAEPERALDC